MHNETKHTAITQQVKDTVYARDDGKCIVCGSPGNPCCHVVRRSQGGRGDTERNIVTLCHDCHYAFDEGLFMGRLRPLGFNTQQDVANHIVVYIKRQYPGWTPDSVTYHKLK